VQSIPGSIGHVGDGCAFAPRCAHAVEICLTGTISLEAESERSVRCLRWREPLA
jgi:ABC-type dipeptide/oligopeptide/nickel transport system ATPase component